MKTWELTEQDWKIEGLMEAKAMGLLVEIGNLNRPSLKTANGTLRYIACRVYPVRKTPAGIRVGTRPPIDYWLYTAEPPSIFMKATGLLASRDKATIGGLPPLVSEDEIPLFPDPLMLKLDPSSSSWPCFEVTLYAPNIAAFMDAPKYADQGSLWAWGVTVMDCFMFTIIESIGLVSPHAFIKTLLQSDVKRFLKLFTNMHLAVFAATEPLRQFIGLIISELVDILKGDEIARIFGKEVTREIANVLGPQFEIAKKITEIIGNFGQAVYDMAAPGYAELFVTLEPRLNPTFRYPRSSTPAQVAVNERASWPIAVTLPDGTLFSFSAPMFSTAPIKTTSDFDLLPGAGDLRSDAFAARVTALDHAQQSYRFSEIVDSPETNPTRVPCELIISTQGPIPDPIIHLRPSLVDSALLPTNPDPPRVWFPNGLGSYIEGVKQGRENVNLRVEIARSDFPDASQLCAETKFPVIVGQDLLTWNLPKEVETGGVLDPALTVNLPATSVNLLRPLTAAVQFAPDGLSVQISSISAPNAKNPDITEYITLPFSLLIEATGMDNNGRPLLVFEPSSAMQVASGVALLSLPDGLKGLISVRRKGMATLKATLRRTAEDETDPNGVMGEATAKVDIQKGKLQLRTTSLPPFIESIFGEIEVGLEMPDNKAMLLSNPMRADLTISPTRLEVASICFNPDDDGRRILPFNVVFEVTRGSSVKFSAERIARAPAQCWTYVGGLKEYIRAVEGGSSEIRITAPVHPDSPYDLEEPPPVTVSLEVQPPSKVIFHQLDELDRQGNSITFHYINSGDHRQLWRTSTVQISGRVENCCGVTSYRMFVDGVDRSEGIEVSTDEKTASFTATISGLTKGMRTVRVEAEKPTDFGNPGHAELELECMGVEYSVTFDGDPLDQVAGTGFRENDMRLESMFLNSVEITVQSQNKPIYTAKPTSSSGSSLGDSWWEYTILLEEGDNVITIQVANAFESVTHQHVVPGIKPYAVFESVANVRVTTSNSNIEITETSGEVKGKAFPLSSGTFTVKDPDGHTWDLQMLANGPFSFNVQFAKEGTYTLKLEATNDFGTSTNTLMVALAPLTWDWDIHAYFYVNDVTTQNIKVQVNLNNSQVADSGKVSWYYWEKKLTLTADQMRKECDEKGPGNWVTGVLPLFWITEYVYHSNLGWINPSQVAFAFRAKLENSSVIARRGNKQIEKHEIVWYDQSKYVSIVTDAVMQNYLFINGVWFFRCFIEGWVKDIFLNLTRGGQI